MRRLMIVAALLLSGRAEAQNDAIRYYPPSIAPSGGTFTGPITLPWGTASVVSLRFDAPGFNNYGWYTPDGGTWDFSYGGGVTLRLNSNVVMPNDSGKLILGTAGDTVISRDAANTLALRNGTAAQQFNLYETYTDASNRSYLAIQATAGAFKLLPQAAGTGTLRVVAIGDGGAKPTCEAATRGGIWYDAGGAGAADTLEVCRKDAADAYAWVSLF